MLCMCNIAAAGNHCAQVVVFCQNIVPNVLLFKRMLFLHKVNVTWTRPHRVKKETSQKQITDFTSFSAFEQPCCINAMLQRVNPKQRSYTSLAGRRDEGKMDDRSVRSEKMDGTDLVWDDKTGKNVDVLNLTRNSRLCSRHFKKEKHQRWLHESWSCLLCLE